MKWVLCPNCQRRTYHSEICQLNDFKHRSICKSPNTKNSAIALPVIKSPSLRLSKVLRSTKEFEIEMNKNLGNGAFAAVFQAKHTITGAKYAVKIFYKSDLFEKKLCDLIQTEISIHQKIRFPHIIRLKFVLEDDLRLYIVMELAENESLANYRRKLTQNMEEKEAFIYFFQTALGIEYLHSHSIIHRDLKLENLLLSSRGNIKICDFGWSTSSTNRGYEEHMTFCGTFECMPPEMFKGSNYGEKVDIWCLGIILFELLYGKMPFKVSGRYNIEFDNNIKISPQCINQIKSLLNVSVENRPTIEDVFEFDWVKMYAQNFGINITEYRYKRRTVSNFSSSSLRLSNLSGSFNIVESKVWGTSQNRSGNLKLNTSKKRLQEKIDEDADDSNANNQNTITKKLSPIKEKDAKLENSGQNQSGPHQTVANIITQQDNLVKNLIAEGEADLESSESEDMHGVFDNQLRQFTNSHKSSLTVKKNFNPQVKNSYKSDFTVKKNDNPLVRVTTGRCLSRDNGSGGQWKEITYSENFGEILQKKSSPTGSRNQNVIGSKERARSLNRCFGNDYTSSQPKFMMNKQKDKILFPANTTRNKANSGTGIRPPIFSKMNESNLLVREIMAPDKTFLNMNQKREISFSGATNKKAMLEGISVMKRPPVKETGFFEGLLSFLGCSNDQKGS